MLNEKPVRLIMRDMTSDMKLEPGQMFSKPQAVAWFKEHYPNVKEGTVDAHLTRMSTNAPGRLHHNLTPDGSDDLLFKVDANRFRLYNAAIDPSPITKNLNMIADQVDGAEEEVGDQVDGTEKAGIGDSKFAYEHDLRDYLAKNLSIIEPGLKLYYAQDVSGIEFPAGGRYIDILAVDQQGNYVVIELKVSKGYDRVVGQLLRYIAWIEKHHADPGQTVRGVIVAKEISEDLRLACSKIPGVQLFEYSLSVTLKPVTTISTISR